MHDLLKINALEFSLTQEKAKQERLEKETKYKEYIKTITFDKFEKEDWKIIFYKKVWEFII